ncbi:hypothetical protein LZ554_007152 [Drepanopeziza brunnea f. sp. 'monogermtubi']|nr:hypothetical protein LZ554_007152 [Drepanopeziza brunnea f. sp. 'monogermtubi']
MNMADSGNLQTNAAENTCFCSAVNSATRSGMRYVRGFFVDPLTRARMWCSRPLTNGRGLVIGGLPVLLLLNVSYHMRSFRRLVVAYEKHVKILVYLSNRSMWRAFGDVVVGRRI